MPPQKETCETPRSYEPPANDSPQHILNRNFRLESDLIIFRSLLGIEEADKLLYKAALDFQTKLTTRARNTSAHLEQRVGDLEHEKEALESANAQLHQDKLRTEQEMQGMQSRIGDLERELATRAENDKAIVRAEIERAANETIEAVDKAFQRLTKKI